MFNAFISYSHSADDKFAPALQNALQKFAKPWYKKRNLEIFRDESSLSASPHLWDNIMKALDQSEYFILLASPLTEKSYWVNREVQYWLEHKSLDNILIALTGGDIIWDPSIGGFLDTDNNSLPPILDNVFKDSPFYIDLRQSKTEQDLSLDNPIFKKEVLKLAAKLHNKKPNDLASEEVSVYRKMILLRNAVVSVLGVLFAGSIVLGLFANYQRKTAQSQLANVYWDNAQNKRAEHNLTEALLYTAEAVNISPDDNLTQNILVDMDPFFPQMALKLLTVYQGDSLNIYENNTLTAISRDGNKILIPNRNNSVRILDVNSENQIGIDLKYKGRGFDANFSPDGNHVIIGSVTADDINIFRLWNILSGQQTALDLKIKGWVSGLFFTDDSKKVLIMVNSDDFENTDVYICDATTGKCDIANSNDDSSELFYPHYLSKPLYSYDQKWKIEVGDNDIARIINVETGEQIGDTMSNGKGGFWTFSKDKNRVLSISNDKVCVWDIVNGIQIVDTNIKDREIKFAQVNSKGSQVLIVSDNVAQVWEIATGNRVGKEMVLPSDPWPVILSPDGTKLLCGSDDTDSTGLTLWDALTGYQIGQNIEAGSGSFPTAFFSFNTKFVIVINEENEFETITIWDATNGHQIDESINKMRSLNSSFSSNSTGNRWVTVNSDNHVRIWEANGFTDNDKDLNISDEIRHFSYSPDKKILLIQTDNTAYLWDVTRNKQIGLDIDLGNSGGLLYQCIFSPDGKQILVMSVENSKKIVRSYYTKNGEQFGKDLILNSRLKFAVFSSDQNQVFTITDNQTQLWDIATGENRNQELETGVKYSIQVIPSPDGKRVAVFSLDDDADKQIVRIWDVTNNKQIGNDIIGKPRLYASVRKNGFFSPDGKRVAVLSLDDNYDKQISRIFDAVNGKKIGGDIIGDEPVFSPDGEWFISRSDENDVNTVRVYNAENGVQQGNDIVRWTYRYQLHLSIYGREEFDSPIFSPDGLQMLLTKKTKELDTIGIWNIADSKKIGSDIFGAEPVFSPDGKTIITRSEGLNNIGQAKLFTSENGKQFGHIMKHKGLVNSAVFSPDGKLILTTSRNEGAQIWDASNGEPIGKAMLHEGGANNALFSPDGRYILSTSPSGNPKNVHIWDLATRREISPEKQFKDFVNADFISSDANKILITIGYGGKRKLRIWELGADLDISADLFKLQAQVSTGFELNVETNQIQSIPPEQWVILKKEYITKASEHYKKCKYRKYNYWSRQYPEEADKIIDNKL